MERPNPAQRTLVDPANPHVPSSVPVRGIAELPAVPGRALGASPHGGSAPARGHAARWCRSVDRDRGRLVTCVLWFRLREHPVGGADRLHRSSCPRPCAVVARRPRRPGGSPRLARPAGWIRGPLCSSVALTMVGVVGLATLVRRGWRPAVLHTAPLVAVYAIWFRAFQDETT